MKSFLSKLFGRTVSFEENISNFVNVVDANKCKGSNELFDGSIHHVDFDNRTLLVVTPSCLGERQEYTIKFQDIVTISRMQDGRLRMWIRKEEQR